MFYVGQGREDQSNPNGEDDKTPFALLVSLLSATIRLVL